MSQRKQVLWRVGLGITFLLASLLLAVALALDVYAGSYVRFVDWLTAAVGVCGGIYLIKSAIDLRKHANGPGASKK
jgi:hypothetical protein